MGGLTGYILLQKAKLKFPLDGSCPLKGVGLLN
jgi:hypothetical protein